MILFLIGAGLFTFCLGVFALVFLLSSSNNINEFSKFVVYSSGLGLIVSTLLLGFFQNWNKE